ncbi:acyl-CoA Delta(11) desaturase-like, partial [Odontomachus brunneus]|uniref:acyl-CoA Delta(11) desaturase-like n=1 Tax=Odontomachus brunneus TaxID=486640 RepID=UPI0013F2458F
CYKGSVTQEYHFHIRDASSLNGDCSQSINTDCFNNRHINPTNNKLVAFLTFGEGWHNYHHVFPWDYKADELGNYMLNITTMFIDFFAKIGWAYDLKQPSQQLVTSAVMKRGDGSHHMWDPMAHPDSKIEE